MKCAPGLVPATLAACALALGSPAATPRVALAASPVTTQYDLNVPPSAFDFGCVNQGPCACPVVSRPTYGSFDLVPTGSDPLYTYYAVERYIASFNNGPGAVAIVGSGTYKIGGEFALVQQMALDLQVEGGPIQHFDSGLVPVAAGFPKIHAVCSVRGFACYDTVLTVDASPAPVASGPPLPPRPNGIAAVTPNPFTRTTSIVIALDGAHPAEVSVLDLAGRRVRELAPVGLLGGAVAWDGRRDDGAMARAGVYWVRVRWAGGSDARRLVKLE